MGDEFRWLHPGFLWLFLPVIVLLWLRGKQARGPVIVYPAVHLLRSAGIRQRSRSGAVRHWLRFLALVALILGLARPQSLNQTVVQESEAVAILMALDLSGSMAALDLSTREQIMTRLDAAKKVVGDFIDEREGDLVGMVAFSGEAFVVSPLTLNREWLQRNLERLELGQLPGTGTAIGTAVGSAVNRLRSSEAASKVIILLTDGENNAGRLQPEAAAEMAAELGIRLYTIGTGSAGRVPIPRMSRDGKVLRNSEGEPVMAGYSSQDGYEPEVLRRMAEVTGGRFFEADDFRSLGEVYQQIDALEKTEVKTEVFGTVREWYAWPLGLALILLVSEQFWYRFFRRTLP